MDDQLLRNTTTHFDAINFSELNDDWIEEVIDNEFTDVDENSMTPGLLFVNDPIETLNDICRVCEAWCNKPIPMEIDASEEPSYIGNVSSRPEEVLWTYLNQMDISIKQILGVIYYLCHNAMKSTSSIDDKGLGLLSAKLYFSCLRVPGSGAYSVFYPNLFRLCIDCFQIPDHIESKDALYKWKHFEELMPLSISVLESLVPLLGNFHLGTDSSTVDYTIRKLSDLVGSELTNNRLNFDIDFMTMPERERRRRYSYSFVLTSLSFQGLTALMHSDLNGDKDHTYEYILSSLNRHVLCLKVRKSATIQAKFLVIKDNCISFMCHNLKNHYELCSELTVTSLKRLCLTVSDKAEFRTAVSMAVYKVMLHLRMQHMTDLIRWILLLIDSAETNNRVFALEVLGHLLEDIPQLDKEDIPENMEIYLSPVPVIFAILTRCDDASPNVRTKALAVLSQHMKRVLSVLMKMQEPSMFPEEVFEEGVELSDVNGDHRIYWYNFKSFRDVLNEMVGIFHRRIEDNNGTARKAALQALENIITFDLEYLSNDNLKLFVLAAKDPNIVIRKQMIQSLTTVLEVYHVETRAQEYWLKCILPLVQDPENTVQAKVLSVLEEKFLVQIFSNKDDERDCVFNLLKKLSCGEFLSHQRYLQKAFSCWKVEKKLRPQTVTKLEKYFGEDKDELLWFYLSIFSAFCKPPSKICELAVEQFKKPENWRSYSFVENILKIIASTFSTLPPDDLNTVREILIQKFENFDAPVEILPMMIEILGKIEKHLKNDCFPQFAAKMITTSVDTITPFVSKSKGKHLLPEAVAIKCFTIIKEFCQMFPANINAHLLRVLKSFIYSGLGGDEASASNAEYSKRISTLLRAHALAALGKICLQDEELAKDLLPIFANEVITSKHGILRNNAVIILTEMCKRYTSYADKYVPLICQCFKDRLYLIRYQTITLLISLLQEDYIKWKGPLFFCLLSTLIDKKEAIQELGKYCLCQLLYEKRPSVFADHFIDCLFVFNHFSPPDNERLAEIVTELARFSLRGDEQREKRLYIYKFMLSYMDHAPRVLLADLLSKEILTCVADSVYPLNNTTESLVKDCFAILSCREIKVFDGPEGEENEEQEERAAQVEKTRQTLVMGILIPVLISLKNCVTAAKSDLLSDIVLFLKDLLQDFKDQVETLLADDKMLYKQVVKEFQNEMRQEAIEAKERKKKQDCAEEAAKAQRHKDHIVEKKKELIERNVIQQGRGSPPSSPGHNNRSVHLLLKTPQNKYSLRQSNNVNGDIETDNDNFMSTETNEQTIRILASTPRVVLRPLTTLEMPNISRIMLEEEES